MDHVTSTLSEVINSSMKRSSTKVMSKQNLDVSSTTMMMHSESLEKQRSYKNAQQLNAVIPSMLPNDVSKHITKRGYEAIESSYFAREGFHYVHVEPYMWVVYHISSFKSPSVHYQDVPIPHYSMCYEVSYDPLKKTIQCSCLMKQHTGLPCSHIYAVLNNVHTSMIHPRYYKSYNSHV